MQAFKETHLGHKHDQNLILVLLIIGYGENKKIHLLLLKFQLILRHNLLARTVGRVEFSCSVLKGYPILSEIIFSTFQGSCRLPK